jgi:hypothetical protein
MARFPVITDPCPLRWATLPTAGRDHCGQCDRQVHNLDALTPAQRETFLGSCSGKVCVAYTVQRRVQRRGVQLGAGLLAAMAGSAAMAGGLPGVAGEVVATSGTPIQVPASALADAEELKTLDIELVVVTGGVSGGDTVRWDDADAIAAGQPDALEDIAPSAWLPARGR